MSELTNLTLAEARDAVRSKSISSRELTQAHIGAMAAARTLNVFITETPERALAMAEASDVRIARQEAGPLFRRLGQEPDLFDRHVAVEELVVGAPDPARAVLTDLLL